MNREYVRRLVLAGSPGTTPDKADDAIERAQHILGNLTHYIHGRSHEHEDLAYMARVVLAATRGEDVVR